MEQHFELVCDVVPPGQRSGSGVFTYVEDLGKEARTKEELDNHFMGPDGLCEYVPIRKSSG